MEPQCQKQENGDFQPSRRQEWSVTAQHRCLLLGRALGWQLCPSAGSSHSTCCCPQPHPSSQWIPYPMSLAGNGGTSSSVLITLLFCSTGNLWLFESHSLFPPSQSLPLTRHFQGGKYLPLIDGHSDQSENVPEYLGIFSEEIPTKGWGVFGML